MVRIILASLGLFAVLVATPAQAEKRALLIGINVYQKPKTPPPTIELTDGPNRLKGGTWQDLDGAVADAQAVKAWLTTRQGFAPANIRMLTDGQATREGILKALQEQLVAPTKPGDRVVFYYSGHGSQRANSKSTEADKKDETIVPTDAPLGADDVRDKELAVIFDQVAERGGSLVVIMDSCHSGSVSRGAGKLKLAPSDPRDVADDVSVTDDCVAGQRCVLSPWKRGVLVLSAAQDDQPAREGVDEKKNPRGAFTVALLGAMAANPLGSAAAVFAAARARLQADGLQQEPVLEATAERGALGVFGDVVPPAAPQFAVQRVSASGVVSLSGGSAQGLFPGSELRSAARNVNLQVSAAKGPATSEAKVVAGDVDKLKQGDLLTVTAWAAPRGFSLPLFFKGEVTQAQLDEAVAVVRTLRERADWVKDPLDDAPTHLVRWSDAGWQLASGTRAPMPLGKSLAVQAIDDAVKATPNPEQQPVRLFVQLPVAQGAEPKLDAVAPVAVKARALDPVSTPGAAQYVLAGRLTDKGLEYAWLHHDVLGAGLRPDAVVPPRTEWRAVSDKQTPEVLARDAAQLARGLAWLQLEAPDDFPYDLVARVRGTRTVLGKEVPGGTDVELVLVRRPGTEDPEQRRLYVFVMSARTGRRVLLYPPSNVENKPELPQTEWVVPTRLKAGKPAVDTFFLVTSTEVIEPSALASPPLITSGPESEKFVTRGGPSPMSQFLFERGTRTRDETHVPGGWSVKRLVLHTVAPK
jgi:hypothetical protein